MIQAVKGGNVRMLPGLFQRRMKLNEDYLMELEPGCLLQNFYIEAGIIPPGGQVINEPEQAVPTLALALFGWPSVLGSRIKARQARVDAAAPAEAAVQEVRDRIRIIDRYSDRTYSPLEVLREVSLAMPEGVTLARLSYDAARREASVECSALSSQPAYEMSNRLKVSPLFARNDIVAGPTENKGTGRTTFTIRLLFAGGADGEGGTP